MICLLRNHSLRGVGRVFLTDCYPCLRKQRMILTLAWCECSIHRVRQVWQNRKLAMALLPIYVAQSNSTSSRPTPNTHLPRIPSTPTYQQWCSNRRLHATAQLPVVRFLNQSCEHLWASLASSPLQHCLQRQAIASGFQVVETLSYNVSDDYVPLMEVPSRGFKMLDGRSRLEHRNGNARKRTQKRKRSTARHSLGNFLGISSQALADRMKNSDPPRSHVFRMYLGGGQGIAALGTGDG